MKPIAEAIKQLQIKMLKMKSVLVVALEPICKAVSMTLQAVWPGRPSASLLYFVVSVHADLVAPSL